MSERNVRKCDNCGRISEACHTEAGWLSIDGSIRMILQYSGRFNGMEYEYEHNKIYLENPDYCSFKCLVDWWRKNTSTSQESAFDT